MTLARIMSPGLAASFMESTYRSCTSDMCSMPENTPEIFLGPTLIMRTRTLSDCALPTCPMILIPTLGTLASVISGYTETFRFCMSINAHPTVLE